MVVRGENRARGGQQEGNAPSCCRSSRKHPLDISRSLLKIDFLRARFDVAPRESGILLADLDARTLFADELEAHVALLIRRNISFTLIGGRVYRVVVESSSRVFA